MTTATLTARPREATERREREYRTAEFDPRPAVQRFRTANREWYPGLCTTCVNQNDCTFSRSAARPLLHCDEFDGQTQPPTRIPAARQDERPRWLAANREWYPGLRNA